MIKHLDARSNALGLIANLLLKLSITAGKPSVTLGKVVMPRGRHILRPFSHELFVGEPNAVKIFMIISTSESPANNGAPVHISTMMAPMAHTSTGELYVGLCKSSSGARYQRVDT